MATRHIVVHQNLWRTAATAFNAVLVAGMPAINMSHVDGLPTTQAWETVATALEVFLLASTEPALPAPQERGLISSIARAFAIGEHGSSTAKAPGDQLVTETAASAVLLGVLQQPPDMVTAEQTARDLELEISVLDTLTDTVLTSCPYASEGMQRRLVMIVDRRAMQTFVGGRDVGFLPRTHHHYGVARRAFVRPRHLNFSPASTANDFSHVCLRKLYVLSSRGEGNQGPHGCLLQVAQVWPERMHLLGGSQRRWC